MSVRSKCQLPGWQMAEISFTEIPLRKADTRKSKRSVGTNKNTAVSYKLDALIDCLKLLTKSKKKKRNIEIISNIIISVTAYSDNEVGKIQIVSRECEHAF